MKKISKKIIVFALVFACIFTCNCFRFYAATSIFCTNGRTVTASAANGASYMATVLYPESVPSSWTSYGLSANSLVVTSIHFYAPKQVKILYDSYALTSSSGKLKEALELGLDTAISYGIDKAKDVISNKFGAAVLSKIVPYLSAASWLKTAYDLVSIISSYQILNTIESAMNQGKGMVQCTNADGSVDVCFWDDGAGFKGKGGQFGVYPTARVAGTYSSGVLMVK